MSDQEDTFDANGPRKDFNRTGEITGGDKMAGMSAKDRLRMKRANSQKSAGSLSLDAPSTPGPLSRSGSAATPMGERTPATSSKSADVRKRLLARRQTEREMATDDDENEGSGRGGPRSPSRRRRTPGGLDKFGKPAKEGDDDDGSGSSEENLDEEEGDDSLKRNEDWEDQDLCTLLAAEEWFPLQVLPQSRSEAEAMHPLMSLPAAQPSILDPRTLRGPSLIEEMDVLLGSRNGGSRGGSGDAEPLLSADGMVLEDDLDSLPADAARALADGLFVQEGPSLAMVLLHTAETTPEALGESAGCKIDPVLKLARVTQRTLRDMAAEVERAGVRQKYAELRAEAAAADPSATDRSARSTARSTENKENSPHTADVKPLGELSLLKQLPTGVVSAVLENPLDERSSTVLVSDVQRAVGGVLGNWGPDATIKERLGPLSVGHDKKSGSRSILRLHVHQMCLTEHPLMNSEERCFASLKSTFSVYRSLMEQRTLLFLSERLQVIVMELQRCLRLHKQSGEAGFDDDDTMLFKALYANLCETLPLLAELRLSLDSLTSSLMEQWKDIKDMRSKAGFTSTRASLTVRAVQGSGGGGGSRTSSKKAVRRGDDEEDGKESERGDDASDGWDKLALCIGEIPALVPQVQALLYAIESAQLDETERAAAEAAKAEDDANEEKEAKKPPPKPARPGAAGAGSETSPRMSSKDLVQISPRSHTAQLHGVFKRHAKLLTAAVTELAKCKCLMPEYVIRVDSDGSLTPTSQLDSTENNRRMQIENTQFKAVVRVNGKRITETHLYPLRYPQLSVDLSQYFEFRVLRQMENLCVDIISYTPACLGSELFITSINVPFPGQLEMAGGGPRAGKVSQTGTHLYAPVIGWLGFSSEEGALSRKAGLLSSETDTLPRDAMVKGSVLIACEYAIANAEHKPSATATAYDGVEENALAVLPPVGSESSAATAWGSGYALGGGMNAQRLLPVLNSMDPNDPRNDILASRAAVDPLGNDEKVFHLFGHDFAISFTQGGHSYENYLRFKEGPRSQLLRLRERSPHLFTEPIPLTDEEINASEMYRRMLAQHTKPSPLLDLEAPPVKDNVGSAGGTRSKLKSFLQRVRNSSTLQQRHSQRKTISTTAAVAETGYFRPLMEIDLENLLPEKKRSLKPKTQVRTTTAMHVNKASLLVQVVAAKNIPLRSETDMNTVGEVRGNNMSQSRRGGSPRKGKRGAGGESDGYNSAGSADGDGPQISEALLDETKVLLRKRARTCVEVRFQEHREATSTITGGAPLWKQSFSLPFRSPNDDYTPSALQQIRDLVVFNLFDEIEEDDHWRGTAMEGENTSRTERRFLGSFSLPFNTIYAMGRVEGIFRLNTPLLNFGYANAGPISSKSSGDALFDTEVHSDEAVVHRPTFFEMMMQNCFKLPQSRPPSDFGHFIHNKTADELEHFASGDGSTYIRIMATLDPLLSTLPDVQMDYASSNLHAQDRPFGQYASMWIRELSTYSRITKERKFKAFGMNSDGQYTLICRYLTAQAPPDGFNTTRSVIHLVSNLPYMSDVHSMENNCDFWCTANQAWEVGAGDEEEHATMLYNYLYYFSLMGEAGSSGGTGVRRGGRRPAGELNTGTYPSEEIIRGESVFLVLGKGMPEGDTVYVMLRDSNITSSDLTTSKGWLIIDPCSGHIYSAMDPSCPLREIYCLATPYNIWANVQYTDKVYESSFDVLDVDMWRPFFGARLPSPTGGLHTVQDDIVYKPTTVTFALDIETAVLGAIKNGIRRWRSKRHRSTTTFHPDACLVMQDLLPKLEKYKKKGNTADIDIEKLMSDAERKMAPILRTRSFRGCPINLPFTDVDEVLAYVKTLSVHESRHPEVQFVIAVKVIPIVNEIVSLWIFVGTLEALNSKGY